jgi:phage gp16-like protein
VIKLLVRFAAWLDARFPAKVTVTLEDYGRIADRLNRIGNDASGFNADFMLATARIAALEESVKALKEALTKASQPAVVADKRRADFVATGRFD